MTFMEDALKVKFCVWLSYDIYTHIGVLYLFLSIIINFCCYSLQRNLSSRISLEICASMNVHLLLFVEFYFAVS